MQGHYHAVVWIDHKQARVFHFDADAFDTALIPAPHQSGHKHHVADYDGTGHAPEDQKYLESVAKSVMDAGAILIVGPANEKGELVKHIKHAHPALAGKIEGVEASDHPSDGEIVAHARKVLKSADRMRPPA
ncbi:MAG: translational machinery protein [Bradyrhizobium sp.]|nr:MAG: translational machinery protein [Bradyrhizobium sp.]